MMAKLLAETREDGRCLLLSLPDSGYSGGTTITALIEQDIDELSFSCSALNSVPPA
jgi:prolyl oligopeptidase